MTILDTHQKQPYEVLDYDISYSTTDLPNGDSLVLTPGVATATFECLSNPLDASLVIGVVTAFSNRVKVWVGGGLGPGPTRYKVTVRASSVGGRQFEDEFIMIVKED